MARAALPHPFRLQHEALALRIHDVEDRMVIIEPIRQGPVQVVIDIFDVEGPDLLPRLYHRAFHRIGPGPHIVHIGS